MAKRLAALKFEGQDDAGEVKSEGGETFRRFKVSRFFGKRKDEYDEWPAFSHKSEASKAIAGHFKGLECRLRLVDEEKGWFTVFAVVGNDDLVEELAAAVAEASPVAKGSKEE